MSQSQHESAALGAAGLLLNLLGAGHVEASRGVTGGAGVDPDAIRALVAAEAGAQMTPLPGEVWGEISAEAAGGSYLVRAPVWTERGRSRLQLELFAELEESDTYRPHAVRVLDAAGDVVLDAHSDAIVVGSARAERTEVDDLRIRRGAFVGNSYGVLIGQITGPFDRAGLDPTLPNLSLSKGQRAIHLLSFAISRLYVGGVDAMVDSLGADAARRVADACAVIGATGYVELFTSPEWFDGSGRLDADALEQAFFDLEDRDPIWPHMVEYIEGHPSVFFTDAM